MPSELVTVKCGCGWPVSARSTKAVSAAMAEHQIYTANMYSDGELVTYQGFLDRQGKAFS